jgi:predicted NBD/HSP70 family sugar kinase
MISKAGNSKILGLGIAIPGVVDPKNNYIEFAPMLNIDTALSCDSFIKSIQEKYKILVLLENDVNCSVVAEQKTRHESNAENIAYIALGQGLGAGLIINGRLHRGCHNSSGEIGYMIWDSCFKSDRSHDGFLESRINTNALLERWPEILEENIPRDVLLEATEYVSEYLSLCIANIQTMIDLDLIVIGGVWGEKLGERLLNKVLEKHKRFCVINVDIDLSKMNKPAVVGAAQLAMIEELNRIFRE